MIKMRPNKIEKQLQRMTRTLLNRKRIRIDLTSKWEKNFKDAPGTYIIFEKGNNICYVGETASVKKRMKELEDTRHHILRRKIGMTIFNPKKKASSKQKFSPSIEKKLDKHIKNKLSVSVLYLWFGRKELEEYIIDKYKPRYNSKQNRRSLNEANVCKGSNTKLYIY